MGRWDGELIYLTKDCPNCEFYRKINEYKLCGGGRAYKFLVPREKEARKCIVKSNVGEIRNNERSIITIDAIISRNTKAEKINNSETYTILGFGIKREKPRQLKLWGWWW